MSGLLLDTHVLLFWLSDSSRLSQAAYAAISDGSQPLYVSVAAIWEMSIKATLGRIEIPPNLITTLADEDINVLLITPDHAMAVSQLPLLHQDPFDRIQIAQSRLEGLQFVTADRRILAYGGELLPA